MRRLLIGLLVVMGCIPILRAQEYSGVTGMIHVPTAEMATEGEARIGFFFLNQEFLPDTYQYEGEKFNTTNHFSGHHPLPLDRNSVCLYHTEGGLTTMAMSDIIRKTGTFT